MTKIVYPKDIKVLKQGDRFPEMYAFWLYILKTSKNFVWCIYSSAPCTFPEDGKIEKMTKKEFVERFTWIYLVDRGNDVAGWLINE